MTQDMITLGFDKILEQLKEHAVSEKARERLAETQPILNETLCRSRMEETTEARRVLDACGAPPLAIMATLEQSLEKALKGAMLTCAELSEAARFCATLRALDRYLTSAAAVSRVIASRQTELPALSDLEEEIDRCVREDEVLSEASPLLYELRKKCERLRQEIREKLNRVLLAHRSQLADSYVTTREGRFVVPVLKKAQSSFPGRAVESSAKGGTVFMEPNAVHEAQNELDLTGIAADEEERRILWTLSDRLAGREEELRRGIRAVCELDMLFARAKLSAAMRAVPVTLTAERRIRLVSARHPLLNTASPVPLDMALEPSDTGVAVTGPNTGGKTVCLKTVGLLCLMAQSALHVPCGEGTVLPLFDRVLCDIGDSQSISQNLSTFSGHITNVIRILGCCSRDSLVLLDELGSGTDPAEGTGIAVAVLEELLRRECLFMVTTHDPQIKRWAAGTEHVVSARMAFDRESLRPLYLLEMGRSGESCAIEIARRLGMEETLLQRAREAAEGRLTPPERPAKPGRDVRRAVPRSLLEREKRGAEGDYEHFHTGDSVMLLPDKKTAIVVTPADREGNVLIQLQGRKLTVNHKRLVLQVPASELYPPDYDFSIIFDTVENRKAAHEISRKYSADRVVILREGKKEE